MNINESKVRFLDRVDGNQPKRDYTLRFDWDNGQIILIHPENAAERVLVTGITREEYVEIEIHAKVKES